MKLKLVLIGLLSFFATSISYASFPMEGQNTKAELYGFNSKATNELTNLDNQVTFNDASVNNNIKATAHSTDKANGGKSQLIALILVILLGGLGIHRFYLGYTGIGIIQLLTLGGFGIWALIDLIRIAMGDLKPKDGDYTETL
ncbi:MAG TPA: TM2 domain-containing protein [Edaphocola sp.]|nr:TM2 domain-containing protein [Edaphocola sp.]